jgi:hypothetical protein
MQMAIGNARAAGMTHGIWLHDPKSRVWRASHAAMHGKAFSLCEGMPDPAEGRNVFPGELSECRCTFRPLPLKRRRKTGCLAWLGLAILIMVLVSVISDKLREGGGGTAPAPAPPAVQAPRKPAAPPAPRGQAAQTPAPAPEVTARRLHEDYQANEVAADLRYKGRTLVVSGTVDSIGKGPLGGLSVSLAAPGLTGVQCLFPASQERSLARLARGQAVSFRCRGMGMTLGTPVLGDCAAP